jgi:orotidine-5'-phosphate decarboxylase
MQSNKVIVALDQMSLEEIDIFLKKPENIIPTVKIGLELYLKHGPDLVNRIHNNYQKEIFLDLKLHDIPITVSKAIHSLKNLPLKFLTLHLSGGEEMLHMAMAEARNSLPKCKILGVSFLTSLSSTDLQKVFGFKSIDDAFMRLFAIANSCQIDGVVSSAHEVAAYKALYPNLLAVVPGIRFEDEINEKNTQDQKRVASPHQAFEIGADYLVMGRSLTQSKNLIKRIEQLNQVSQ